MEIHAKNASLRRHYPVQVVRVKKQTMCFDLSKCSPSQYFFQHV
jgi:hypothetical protein